MAEPEGGNPAVEQVVDPNPANPPAETPKTEAELRQELETLRGRYNESAEEGKRRAAQVDELNGRLKALEQARSLNEQDRQAQQQQFVPRDQFVEFWTAKGATPEWAQARYDIEHEQFRREVFRDQQIQALGNRLKFREELDAQMQVETNPEVRQAVDFWKDNPVMAALPLPDQLKQFKAISEKFGVAGERSTRRDLTAVKQAAGGPTGGRSGGTASATAEEDAQAKTLGFPNARAMADFSKCTTAAEARAWETKWKTKL